MVVLDELTTEFKKSYKTNRTTGWNCLQSRDGYIVQSPFDASYTLSPTLDSMLYSLNAATITAQRQRRISDTQADTIEYDTDTKKRLQLCQLHTISSAVAKFIRQPFLSDVQCFISVALYGIGTPSSAIDILNRLGITASSSYMRDALKNASYLYHLLSAQSSTGIALFCDNLEHKLRVRHVNMEHRVDFIRTVTCLEISVELPLSNFQTQLDLPVDGYSIWARELLVPFNEENKLCLKLWNKVTSIYDTSSKSIARGIGDIPSRSKTIFAIRPQIVEGDVIYEQQGDHSTVYKYSGSLGSVENVYAMLMSYKQQYLDTNHVPVLLIGGDEQWYESAWSAKIKNPQL